MDLPEGAPSFSFRLDLQPPQPASRTSGTERKFGSDDRIYNGPASSLQPVSLPPRPVNVMAPSSFAPQLESGQKNTRISATDSDPRSAGPALARPKLRPATRRRDLSSKPDNVRSATTPPPQKPGYGDLRRAAHTQLDAPNEPSGPLYLDYDDPKTPATSFKESTCDHQEIRTIDRYRPQYIRQDSLYPARGDNNTRPARGCRGGRGRTRGQDRELLDSYRPTTLTGKRARIDHYSPTRHRRQSRSPSPKRSRYYNTQHELAARSHEGLSESNAVRNNVQAVPENLWPPINKNPSGHELDMGQMPHLSPIHDAQPLKTVQTERSSGPEYELTKMPPWIVPTLQSATTTERPKPNVCKKLSAADMVPGKIVYVKKDDRYSWTAHPVLIVDWIGDDGHIPVMGITSWKGLSSIYEKWGEGVRQSWRALAFRSRYMLIRHGDDSTHDNMPIIYLKDDREMAQKSYLDLHHIRAVKPNRMEKFMPGWNPREVELADPLRTLDTIMDRRYAYLLDGQYVYSHF